MAHFSIPYNSDLSVIKKIIRKYRGKIEEIYFAIDSSIATTSKRKNEKMTIDEARKLLTILKRNGIKSNILINGAYQGNRDPERIKDFIHSIGGVDAITIADLYLLEVFKNTGCTMHISRLAQLNSVEKIRRILARYPDLVINIDNDLNRDYDSLIKISRLKEYFPHFKIKLMVNEGCLFHCTGRTRHSWLLCLSDNEKKYFGSYFACFDHVTSSEVNKEMIKSAFIRPEDLSFYRDAKVVDIFKIVGRHKKGKTLIPIIDAYMKEHYKGSLIDLMGTGVMRSFSIKHSFDIDNRKFPKDFVEKVCKCDKSCIPCTYCQDIAKQTQHPLLKQSFCQRAAVFSNPGTGIIGCFYFFI